MKPAVTEVKNGGQEGFARGMDRNVMEAQEILNEGLKRQYKVTVPAAELAGRLDSRLAEMAKNARIPGFRPGKVPVKHLKRLYGKQVMAEVMDEAIRDTVQKVLSDNALKAAYQPDIALADESKEAVEKIINGEADLVYTMTFEVTPEIEVGDLSDIALTRYKVKVPEEDIEEAVKNIAEQFKDYEDRPEGEPAEEGDRVVISFVGRIDGEEFEGGSAEDVPLVLGSGQFIPGFEEQLIGVKAGEERTIEVTFPEQYGVEKLAGKKAEFTVRVKSVEKPVEQEIDDAFAQKIGFENLEQLKQRVREQVEAEFEQTAYTELKRAVLDALDARYDFPVPQRLVDSEFEQIWHTLEHEMKDAGRTFEDEGTTEEEARKEYRDIAERRVRLGLLLGTIGEQAGITVSDEELQQALIERARQFPGQEKQVFEYYREHPEALIELRGPIFEQKVIDHIIEQAQVTEKEVTRDELEDILKEEEEKAEAEKKDGAKEKKAKSGKKSAKSAKSASGKAAEKKTTKKASAKSTSAKSKSASKSKKSTKKSADSEDKD